MSKMFEMLQQAQRDQELLKQSAPPATITAGIWMSCTGPEWTSNYSTFPRSRRHLKTEPAPPSNWFPTR